jgi:hypothetical protein
MPFTEYPVPVADTWEIVTFDPPVLVTVSDTVDVVFVTTFPKLKLLGEEANVPGLTAVPERATFRVGLVASETNVNWPLSVPTAVGFHVTCTVMDLPPLTLVGQINPLTLNPLPIVETELM